MAKLELSIFSFDKRLDFQSGYIRDIVHCKASWNLSDLLQHINAKSFGYQEFGYDLDKLHLRINNMAIFGNISLKNIIANFGNYLILEPLSKKYVKKDLIVDYELAFKKYSDFFAKMDFLNQNESYELIKYLPVNFIIPNYDDNYLGDGFMLYVKWLIKRHTLHTKKLLGYISNIENGIFNHINTASFLFPANNEIDMNIEFLQKEILNQADFKEYEKFSKHLESQFNFHINNEILKSNKIYTQSNFIESIL